MKIFKALFNQPIHLIVMSFIGLILIGSVLLFQDFSSRNVSFLDCLFTSASAVCVTGLIVVDTPTAFTFTGQIIILILIQLGGLGFMTFSIGLFALFSGGLSVRWHFALTDIYNDYNKFSMKALLLRIILYTFIIESLIAVILFLEFRKLFAFDYAVWLAVFHSVSAFCNAGFSLFTNNLINYNTNTVIMSAIAVEIILGGIGFFVMAELLYYIFKNKKISGTRLSVHTKLVLIITTILILSGTFIILFIEWNNSFKGMSSWYKIINAVFQSVTCRTAGFNTIDIALMRENSLLVMIALMFIGGSPGSIAGGIKTATFGIIILLIIAKIRGKKQVVIWKRAISDEIIDKSFLIFVLSIFVIVFATFFIVSFNYNDNQIVFFDALFEMTSAFGTVGLSTGATIKLNSYSKIITIVVMFVGRLGPLTLVSALGSNKKSTGVEYPEENIMVG